MPNLQGLNKQMFKALNLRLSKFLRAVCLTIGCQSFKKVVHFVMWLTWTTMQTSIPQGSWALSNRKDI